MIGTVKKGKIKNFGIFVTENIHIVFKQDTFIGQCSRLVHTKNVHASKALHGVDIFDNRLLLDMERLPLTRQALITIGSISGISPTATDNEKTKDSSHLPFVMPRTTKIIGISMAIKRSITNAMELAPFETNFDFCVRFYETAI